MFLGVKHILTFHLFIYLEISKIKQIINVIIYYKIHRAPVSTQFMFTRKKENVKIPNWGF